MPGKGLDALCAPMPVEKGVTWKTPFCIRYERERLPLRPHIQNLSGDVVPKRGVEYQKTGFLLRQRERGIAGLKALQHLRVSSRLVSQVGLIQQKQHAFFSDRVQKIGSWNENGAGGSKVRVVIVEGVPLRGSEVIRHVESTVGW